MFFASVLFEEDLNVISSKSHRSANVVGGELTSFDEAVDGHLGHPKKLGEFFDGVKLLG